MIGFIRQCKKSPKILNFKYLQIKRLDISISLIINNTKISIILPMTNILLNLSIQDDNRQIMSLKQSGKQAVLCMNFNIIFNYICT